MYEYCRVKVRLEWMREIEHILYTTPVNYTNWTESYREWMHFTLPELERSWQE